MSFEEKLIALVRETEYIYNKEHPKYRKTYLKQQKWKEIAKKLGVDEHKCRQRWSTLRDQYGRELRKLYAPSGSACEDQHRRWKYFDLLHFLRHSSSTKRISESNSTMDQTGIVRSASRSSRNVLYTKEEEEEEEEEEAEEADEEEVEECTLEIPEIFVDNGFTSPKTGARKRLASESPSSDSNKRKRCERETKSDIRSFITSFIKNKIHSDDKYDIFGKNIANMCRDANLRPAQFLSLQLGIIGIVKSAMNKNILS